MKTFTRRMIALSMTAALGLSSAGLAFADNYKDETVYVLTGNAGNVNKIIVSDWLKNKDGDASLVDASDLTGIENVKGDETFTLDGTVLTWDAKGNDIYYRGTTDKALPVTLSVHFLLDGEEISPEELAGKSGRVTVRFDYENTQYEEREINGAVQKIYVPFAAITGIVLDNEHFRNVEVTGGKLVNDGERTAIVGLAFPGMEETLGLEDDKVSIPSYLEFTADATDFQMAQTLTLVTNQVFEALEDSELTSTDDLSDAINKLTDGLTQLTDGSGALYDGLNTLLDKTGELKDGVQQLLDGTVTLKDGTASLLDGAGQLSDGATTLTTGLSTLVANNDTLNGGAQQVFNTLLATATTQLKAAGIDVPDLTIENYSQVLTQVLDSLSEDAVHQKALETVTGAVNENLSVITDQVTEAVREQVAPQVTAAVQEQVTAQVTETVRAQVAPQVITAATGLNQEAYNAAVEAGQISAEQQAAVTAAIDAQMSSDDVQALIASNTEAQMQSEQVQGMVATALEQQMQTEQVQGIIAANVDDQVNALVSQNMQSEAVQTQIAAAAEGRKTIETLVASLDSYNTFYTGLQTYTNGVASAADGAAQLLDGSTALASGAEQLNDGAVTLHDGVQSLSDSMPELIDGVQQLRDGAQQLKDGIQEFADEGVQKISELVNGDVESLIDRVNAMLDASRNYRTFSERPENMDGQVKFIYRTDEVK